MTKKELAEFISKNNEWCSVRNAENMITTVTTAIAGALASGESIQIVGLANFKVVTKKATTARNPATGEVVNVPEKKVVKVAISKAITDKLNG